MLYSALHDIGFAHYPKTAGSSLTRWFRGAFPDAAFVETHPLYEVNHLPVRESLERLELVPGRGDRAYARLAGSITKMLPRRLARRIAAWLSEGVAGSTIGPQPSATRIIGVVREPFEMLVSLFEYWRGYDFPQPPTQPLICAARGRSFREFLALAVVDGMLPNYHDFFDMNGPAAANTRLLDFTTLQASLRHVCREFGVRQPTGQLGFLNAGPNRHRDHGRYREEAGPLLRQVRSHFRWYYEVGVRSMVTCPGAAA